MAEKFASLELSQKVSQQFAQMVKIIRHKKVNNPLLVAFKSRILLIKIFLRSTNGKVKNENINFWIWGYRRLFFSILRNMYVSVWNWNPPFVERRASSYQGSCYEGVIWKELKCKRKLADGVILPRRYILWRLVL